MLKKTLSLLSSTLLFQFALTLTAVAQYDVPRSYEERLVIQAVRQIHSAEMTYQAATGKGDFGTLAQLAQANLIDPVLAGGGKYGYVWVLAKTPRTVTAPAGFTLTATPRSYPKTGRKSFYLDQRGEIHAADKRGEVATGDDLPFNECALYGPTDNERCTIRDLRALVSAQMTYQSTVGEGNFGLFDDLDKAGLINARLASGVSQGYCFHIYIINNGKSPTFETGAEPCDYGRTGFRSFFVDQSGIIRGADHGGDTADENDPPVEE
jgi:hypothetical protein